MKEPKIKRLRKRCGLFKHMPQKYELPILTALSRFPELKYTRIHFQLTLGGSTPYFTVPAPRSFLQKPERRTYFITLLEVGPFPLSQALFKNLPLDAQVAVIAHELTHVLQLMKRSAPEMFLFSLKSLLPSFRRKIERGADLGAIAHGFGQELYQHAMHIRSIPGYIKEHPEINKYYLRPSEIWELLKS